MQKVQTDLKAVGITLQLNPVEISVWADKISTDGIPVTMLYFAPDHTDSSQYVQYFGLLEGSQWQTLGRRPTSSPEQADLLDKAFAEQDASGARRPLQAARRVDDRRPRHHPGGEPEPVPRRPLRHPGPHYSACCNLVLADLSRG